jgi:hypothetical protein
MCSRCYTGGLSLRYEPQAVSVEKADVQNRVCIVEGSMEYIYVGTKA